MERFDDALRMGYTVEKIGIAEGDVLRSGGNLLANVGEDDVDGHDAKLAGVNGDDRAMTAEMFAAAGRLGVARGAMLTTGQGQMSVVAKRRQAAAIGNFEREVWKFPFAVRRRGEFAVIGKHV